MQEMIKTTNEIGKTVWIGATLDSVFDVEMFHWVDMSNRGGNSQWALHTNLGSLTVLDRMTGFGHFDIETGYRDERGEFWLASGNMDVRYSDAMTIGEAIAWVKKNANNCVGNEQ